MRKRWWLVVGLVVVVGGGLLVSRLAAGRAGPAAAETVVETAVVERGTLLVTVDGSGSLAPQQEIVVPFEASGRVVEVLVRTGSEAGSGDVLARLDDTDARRAVANVELTVKQSEVGLASAQLTLEKLLEWEADGSSVELAVYDVTGRKVKHLVSGSDPQAVRVVRGEVQGAVGAASLAPSRIPLDRVGGPGGA